MGASNALTAADMALARNYKPHSMR
ncbi:hypothetical protein [Bacillus sp. T3]